MGGLESALGRAGRSRRAGDLRLQRGAPLIQLDRIDHSRIDTFGQVLAELARRPSIAGISLGELAERCHEWPGDGAPFDPIAGYDGRGRRPTATGTRLYSESYLASLESAVAT